MDRGRQYTEDPGTCDALVEGGDALTARADFSPGEVSVDAPRSTPWRCRGDSLRVGSINVDTMFNKLTIVDRTLSDLRVDICALQETRFDECSLVGEEYTYFFSGCVKQSEDQGKRDKKRGGVGVAVRKNLVPVIEEIRPISDRLLLLRLRGKQINLVIICVYAPVGDRENREKIQDFYRELKTVRDAVKKDDACVILGDLNASVGKDMVGSSSVGNFLAHAKSCYGARALVGYCEEEDFCIGGTFFEKKRSHAMTFYYAQGASQIDHVLIDGRHKSCLEDVRAYPEIHLGGGSGEFGHRAIVATLRCRLRVKRKAQHRPVKPDLQALKEPEIAVALSDRLEKLIEQGAGLLAEGDWLCFKKSLTNACMEVAGPEVTPPKKKPWMSEETFELIKQKRALLVREGEAPRTELRALQVTVKRAVRADKQKYSALTATKVEESIRRNDTRQAFRLVRSCGNQGLPPIRSIRAKNGTVTSCQDAILTRWNEHFCETLNVLPSKEVEDAAVHLSQSLGPAAIKILEEPITPEEVSAAIKRGANGKAPGEDGIVYEMLKSSGPYGVAWLARIINKIWSGGSVPQDWKDSILIPLYKGKGATTNCDNYRGISLLSVPGKILTAVMGSRLAAAFDDKLLDGQHGFRRNRGTTGGILGVRNLVASARAQNEEVFTCFVDLSKAFDSVPRKKLWGIMESMGFPKGFVRILSETHSDAKCKVRDSGKLSEGFKVQSGVRQGCSIAPLLFNLYFDVALRDALEGWEDEGIKVLYNQRAREVMGAGDEAEQNGGIVDINALLYADDCVICAPSEHELQRIIHAINKILQGYGLQINAKKTEVGYVVSPCRREELKSFKFMCGEEELKHTTCFKYLGSLIDFEKHGLHAEMDARKAAAVQACGALKAAIWNRPEVTKRSKKRIFDALVVSRLTYATHTWICTQTEVNAMERVYMKCMRQALKIPWEDKISNPWVRLGVKANSFEGILHKARLRTYGNILRLPDESELKHLALGALAPTRGNDKKVRFRRQWVEVAEDSLAYLQERIREKCKEPSPPTDELRNIARTDEEYWEALLELLSFVPITRADDRRMRREAGIGTYVCEECNHAFDEKRAFILHLKAKHGIETVRAGNDCLLQAAPKRLLRCEECDLEFGKPAAMSSHFHRIHGGGWVYDPLKKVIPCGWPDCDALFETERKRSIHRGMAHKCDRVQRKRGQLSLFGCTVCGAKYKNQAGLSRHQKVEHAKQFPSLYAHPCTLDGCSAAFDTKRGASLHMVSCAKRLGLKAITEEVGGDDSPQERMTCAICLQTYANLANLKRHRTWHKKHGHAM
eukprot:GEMP01000577.1.p1 GENE.GEMP01000577.1~~GEMP01000577.1.p1  ORF type:complete len:1315 (+),score=230.29 GEMP01000577.1:2458-6402(+)